MIVMAIDKIAGPAGVLGAARDAEFTGDDDGDDEDACSAGDDGAGSVAAVDESAGGGDVVAGLTDGEGLPQADRGRPRSSTMPTQAGRGTAVDVVFTVRCSQRHHVRRCPLIG